MKIRTISIFICIILITSATCVPILSSPNILQIDSINKDKLSSNELKYLKNNNDGEDIFLKIINDLAYGKINDESFSFYTTYFDEFFSKIKSVDDLKDSKYLSELNLKIDDIYQMKTYWELYISDKTDLKNIMKNLNINENTSFLIIIVLWVFVNGAAAVNRPDVFPVAVILAEAVFFGIVAGSAITQLIFENTTNPFLTNIYNFLNNSNILPSLKNLLLMPINIMLGLIESKSPMIIAINGWIFINIFLATFLYLHSSFAMFKFVASGLWFIFPFVLELI
ncbi:MAG: hypothetical protein BV457_01375 [Thermoplasmata archaeon M9B1D]|nr:MAG: hypothetical protein BV457_01375 [Thermoplasmata archaeon M9B1D]